MNHHLNVISRSCLLYSSNSSPPPPKIITMSFYFSSTLHILFSFDHKLLIALLLVCQSFQRWQSCVRVVCVHICHTLTDRLHSVMLTSIDPTAQVDLTHPSLSFFSFIPHFAVAIISMCHLKNNSRPLIFHCRPPSGCICHCLQPFVCLQMHSFWQIKIWVFAPLYDETPSLLCSLAKKRKWFSCLLLSAIFSFYTHTS